MQSDICDTLHMPAADAAEHVSGLTIAQTSLDPGRVPMPGLISMASIRLVTDHANGLDPAITTNVSLNVDSRKNYQPWA